MYIFLVVDDVNTVVFVRCTRCILKPKRDDDEVKNTRREQRINRDRFPLPVSRKCLV